MEESEMDQNYSMGFGALLSKIDFKWTEEYQMVENAKRALTDAEKAACHLDVVAHLQCLRERKIDRCQWVHRPRIARRQNLSHP